MIRGILIAAVALATPSIALADQLFAVTPSGTAEALFGDTPQATVSAIAGKCMDLKFTVTTSTSSEVVCQVPMSMGQSVLGQLLMGNSYSTPPSQYIKINVSQVGDYTRAQAIAWMELQMAFGQMRRTDLNGVKNINDLINFLMLAGGSLPIGTTFPNHAKLGFTSTFVKTSKFSGLSVGTLEAGSPAEKAGLQSGDVVTAIAGKRLKTDADYLEGAAAAAKMASYPVEYIRGDKKMTATLALELRPAITAGPAIKAKPIAPAPVVTSAPPASIADELAKLAKLKADGILSDGEFSAQKKKLLGQ